MVCYSTLMHCSSYFLDLLCRFLYKKRKVHWLHLEVFLFSNKEVDRNGSFFHLPALCAFLWEFTNIGPKKQKQNPTLGKCL